MAVAQRSSSNVLLLALFLFALLVLTPPPLPTVDARSLNTISTVGINDLRVDVICPACVCCSTPPTDQCCECCSTPDAKNP